MKKKLLGIIGIYIGIISILLPGCNTTSTLTSSTIITATATPIAPQLFQAPMTIDKTFNGKVIHVNLVKFTGTAPSANSIVTINDITTTVNSDGTYYAYFDLDPGTNSIQIKTNSNGTITSEQIAVTFTPPITIFLDYPWPPPDATTDYTTVPIDLTGVVNNPLAKVEINGNTAAVSTDGSFSAQIQLKQGNNSIEAVATLGNDSDTDGFNLPVNEDGTLGLAAVLVR